MTIPPVCFEGITAVIRSSSTRHLVRIVDALVTEGIANVEFTLTTPGVLDFLAENASRWDGATVLGVGTVLSAHQAEQSIDAGAAFLVTPSLRPAVSTVAATRNIPVAVGALTPTEVLTAHESGAGAVKIFPAATVAASYLAHLRGPMPWLRAMPSGGVDLEQIPAWLSAGAVGVSLGSPLLADAPETGQTTTMLQRLRRAQALMHRAPA